MKGRYMRFVLCGPGGRKCTCCFPAPGKRRREFKRARLRELKEARKLEEQDGG